MAVAVGKNDDVMDDEVMLSEEEGVPGASDGCEELMDGPDSEGGSSDGRIGVGSTVEGRGISGTPPVIVVLIS